MISRQTDQEMWKWAFLTTDILTCQNALCERAAIADIFTCQNRQTTGGANLHNINNSCVPFRFSISKLCCACRLIGMAYGDTSTECSCHLFNHICAVCCEKGLLQGEVQTPLKPQAVDVSRYVAVYLINNLNYNIILTEEAFIRKLHFSMFLRFILV